MSTIEVNESDRIQAELIFRTWQNDRDPPPGIYHLPSHGPSPHFGKLRLIGVHPDFLPILTLHGIKYERVE